MLRLGTVLSLVTAFAPVGCASPSRPAGDGVERDAIEAQPAPVAAKAAHPAPEARPEPEPEPAGIDIVVAAGEHDRANTPVSVMVAVPEALAKCRAVRVRAQIARGVSCSPKNLLRAT